jgi:hypothetical protein
MENNQPINSNPSQPQTNNGIESQQAAVSANHNPVLVHPPRVQTAQQQGSSSPATNSPISNHAHTFLTGSQLQLKETPLPKGMYVLIAIGVVGFVISFFDVSQNSLVYTIDLLLILTLTIGLFFRLEMARKLLFYLSILTVIGSMIAVVGFIGLQDRVNRAKQSSDAAIARLEGQALTSAQRQQLDAAKSQLDLLQKQFGKSAPFVFGKYAITIVVYSGVVIYLTRPKIKEVFER